MKGIHYFLLSIFAFFSYGYASDSSYVGLGLEKPFFRKPLAIYLAECEAHSIKPKAVLGAGHITQEKLEALTPTYNIEEGPQALTQSYDSSYAFHEHRGWYTMSAEIDEAFASDVTLNLQKGAHRKEVFTANTFDIIFDETYHPDVMSLGLIEDIAQALKSEGVFIFPVALTKEEGLFTCGHKNFKHEIDFYNSSSKMKFESLNDVEEYWHQLLIKSGFKAVKIYESPLTQLMKAFISENNIQTSQENHLTVFENYQTLFIEYMKVRGREIARQSEAYKIDPLFEYVGLSTYYIIAQRGARN